MTSTITEFTHLQIPLEEIVKATNNFADENVIGKGGFGNVYKGQLLRSGKLMNIAARRLDRKYGQGDVEFWTEISVLSSFKGENIVSLVGFCDEKGEKIIINSYNAKGSLSMYLSDPTLTWMQRLNISNSILLAIGSLDTRVGSNYYIIHRNINSSTILLDDKWVPSLSGFEFSIKHPIDRRNQVFLCDAIGTMGYMDPATEKSGGVTHKSDIYSMGVVLFEIMCGRKANQDNSLLAPLAKRHYENGTLKDIIHPDLWNQMAPESVKPFADAAYSCLADEQAHRPNAFYIVGKINWAQDRQREYDPSKEDQRRSNEAEIEWLREEYHQKISTLERKVYTLTRERDTLRREQNKRSDVAALLKEKDEIITQVMAEGEALSKKQAIQESTIRKLRAQVREFEDEKKGLKSKLQIEENKVESLKRDEADTEKLMQETIEKNQA